jgi:hypothetical protein
VTRPLTSAERQRLRTPANLWRALIPLLVIVGLLVLVAWPRDHGSSGVHVIDVAGPIAAAQQQAGFDVLVPTGLSSGWRPTSSQFTPSAPSSGASFRIGYVTPANQYAEFVESSDAPDAVAAQYGPLTTDGAATITATGWDRFHTTNNRTLLRHTSGKVTVVVTGSASQTELIELAASLR